MKKCVVCHEEKPITDFYRHKGCADGHMNECAHCFNRRRRRPSTKNTHLTTKMRYGLDFYVVAGRKGAIAKKIKRGKHE